MPSCQDYSNLLLDSLYGALEPDEEQTLHTHLSGCAHCQASLAEAREQQGLLARAARIYDHLPPYQAPSDGELLTPHPAAAVASQAQTLRLPQSRRGRRRRWTLVAAAAAILFAVLGGSLWYERCCAGYRDDTGHARQQIESLDMKIKLVQEDFRTKSAKALEQAPSPTHLRVLGPLTYHPDAQAPYRITTRDVFGKPQPTPLVIRWKGEAEREFRFDSPGELVVSLPAELRGQNGKATLEVEAPGTEPVRETIQVQEPTLVTHVAVSKSAYRIGEVLFFRTLTLQRFSLKPPAEKVCLVYALRDAQGKVRKQHIGFAGESGIGGGEFALTKDLADGEYTLEVSEYDITPAKDPKAKSASAPRMAPQRVGIVIHRGIAAGRAEARIATASALVGQNLPGMVVLAPVTTPRPVVDFFPEGGDLVAGLPTRVYYRVRPPVGEASEAEGRIIIRSSKEVVLDAPRRQSVGVFTFTPQRSESYTLRVTWPKRPGENVNWAETANPFGDLLQPRGLALAVPQAVGREGDSLRIEVRNTGPETRVLLLAVCRGRVVDQRFIDVPAAQTDKDGHMKAGEIHTTLSPVSGASGLVRITAYQVRDEGQLAPVAERLVYQAPAEELILTAHTDKSVYQPNDAVELRVDARDGRGNPVPAWILGMVIDERAAASRGGLPAEFLLFSDLPSGLDNPDLLLGQDPIPACLATLVPAMGPMIQALETARRLQAAQALDLELGTNGWRRFVRHEAPVFVQGGQQNAAPAETPVLLSRENASPVELAKRYQAARERAVENIRGPLEQELQQLVHGRDENAGNASVAALALVDFQESVRQWLRGGVVGIILMLLGVGGVLVLIGVVRLVRRQGSPRPALASALGLAGAALVIYVAGIRGLDLDQPRGPGDDLLAEMRAKPPLLTAAAGLPPLAAGEASRLLFAQAAPRHIAPPASRSTRPALAAASEAFSPERFGQAMKEDQRAQDAIKKVKPLAGVASGPQKLAALNNAATFARVYAQNAGSRDADTLLWAPGVVLKDGPARFSFRLPQTPGRYRILLYGNTPAGRLGFYRATLSTSVAESPGR